ncbi:MAG: hypothetical protein Q8Q49_02115 [bacterium]|nr:hypothetical protein [bacterium]
MDTSQPPQQGSTEPTQAAPADTAQAAAALSPQKMPFDKKWWQLPRTVYIVLALFFLLSIGSTVYLFFAPQGIFTQPSGLSSLSQSLNASLGSKTPTPTQAAEAVAEDTSASLTPTTSPTPTPDPTTSWFTYTNATYGYSFKYPADWKVTSLGSLEPQIPSYITVNPGNTATPSSALSITISASTRTFAQEVALRSSTKTALTVNGLQASLTQEKNSAGSTWTDVVITGTKYTYILIGKSSYYSIFTPFYSTFKLL